MINQVKKDYNSYCVYILDLLEQLSEIVYTLKSLGRFFFMMDRRAKATLEPIAILIVVMGCKKKEMKELQY